MTEAQKQVAERVCRLLVYREKVENSASGSANYATLGRDEKNVLQLKHQKKAKNHGSLWCGCKSEGGKEQETYGTGLLRFGCTSSAEKEFNVQGCCQCSVFS